MSTSRATTSTGRWRSRRWSRCSTCWRAAIARSARACARASRADAIAAKPMETKMASRPVVLITGAGRGIGAAAAGLAAARGYDVAVNYKSDEKSAADVMAAVKARGGRGLAVRGDMGVET